MKRLPYLIVFSGLILIGSVSAQAAMTAHTYQRLETVQELIRENAYPEAEKKLKQILEKLPSGTEDLAYVYHTAGMFYLQQTDYKQADEFLLKAHDLQVLPDKTKLYLLQTLAGLRMQTERYNQAIPFYEAWMKASGTPSSDVYMGLGAACHYTEKHEQARRLMTEATGLFPEKEGLWQLLFASCYELKDLSGAAHTLTRMLRRWPDNTSYWEQLAGIYLEMNDTDACLEIMQAGIIRGTIAKESSILQFVYALYEAHLPYKAACILETAISTGRAAENRKHLELLSSMYQEAKDREQAISALKRASDRSEDGSNDYAIAQLYFEEAGALDQVILFAKKAIEKGVKQEGNAHMLIAYAYVELEQPDSARLYLEQAKRFDETRESAVQWLNQLGS